MGTSKYLIVGSKYLYGGKNRTMIKSIYKENIYESNEEDIKNEDNYVWDEPYVKKTDVIGIIHTKCGSHYPATMKTFNKGYDTCFTCKAMLGKNVKWTKTKLDNLIEFLSGDSLEIVSEYKGTKSLLTLRLAISGRLILLGRFISCIPYSTDSPAHSQTRCLVRSNS